MLFEIELAREKVCLWDRWGAFQVESRAGVKAVWWESLASSRIPVKSSEKGMAGRNVAPEEAAGLESCEWTGKSSCRVLPLSPGESTLLSCLLGKVDFPTKLLWVLQLQDPKWTFPLLFLFFFSLVENYSPVTRGILGTGLWRCFLEVAKTQVLTGLLSLLSLAMSY